jgi:outer membrane protein OmpA-like peptidoglycan-associated protein
MRFALILISVFLFKIASSQNSDDSIIVKGFVLNEYNDEPVYNAILEIKTNDSTAREIQLHKAQFEIKLKAGLNYSLLAYKKYFFDSRDLKIDSKEAGRIIEHTFYLDSFELTVDYFPPYILFDYMSTQIKKEYKIYLDTIAPVVKNHPDLLLEIHTRCSCREVKIDKKISKKRGKSVKKYLKNQGIKGSSIIIKDEKDLLPVNICYCENSYEECSEEEMAQNRNVYLRWVEKSGWLWFRKK